MSWCFLVCFLFLQVLVLVKSMDVRGVGAMGRGTELPRYFTLGVKIPQVFSNLFDNQMSKISKQINRKLSNH